MKCPIVSSLIVLACTSAVFSEELVREVSWSKLKEAGRLSAGEVLSGHSPDPADQLKVENLEQEPKTFTVLELDRPGVTAQQYALIGEVRYEDVAPGSYLEMWNCFADGGRYFSRTLGDSGPMRRLEGSSDWRPFTLPFFIGERPDRPGRLEVNVVLAGRGTVYLGPLRLVQYPESGQSAAAPGAWWDDRTAGLIGGIGGAMLGCLGALLGTLGGLGRARRFVLVLAVVVTVCGVASLAAGIVALGLGQPYAVYYPLLLGGVIATLVFGLLLPVIRRRYEQIELRRMAAMDLGARASEGLKPSG